MAAQQGIIRREAMSSVDVAWLRMDDPANLMMITGVLVFAEPLAYERLCATVRERLLRFERFQQRVVEPRAPLGAPQWETDPGFDLGYHVQRLTLPPPGDKAALQALVSAWMSVPLERARPLWQFHLIEEYEGGSALLARLHHSIADGIALVRVLLSLTDDSPDAAWEAPEQRERRQSGRLAPLQETWQWVTQEGMETLQDPGRVLDAARMGTEAVARLGKILVRPSDPQTAFKGELGVPKRAAWSQPVPLADVKALGKVTGGTVNDVLLTAMTGALRRYLQGRGERVDGLNFHAVVPVNLRPLDGPIELGNKFGLVFLSLPVGIGDQVERLQELKRRMDALKHSPEAVALFGLLNAVGMGPAEIESALVKIFGMKATGIMTNVPGPRQQLYLAGSPLQDIMFWVPQSGRLGLGVSIISYNGEVLLGVAVDAGLVPDPEAIIAAYHQEFADMYALVEQVAGQAARCQATTQRGTRCRNRARPGTDFCHVHAPS